MGLRSRRLCGFAEPLLGPALAACCPLDASSGCDYSRAALANYRLQRRFARLNKTRRLEHGQGGLRQGGLAGSRPQPVTAPHPRSLGSSPRPPSPGCLCQPFRVLGQTAFPPAFASPRQPSHGLHAHPQPHSHHWLQGKRGKKKEKKIKKPEPTPDPSSSHPCSA